MANTITRDEFIDDTETPEQIAQYKAEIAKNLAEMRRLNSELADMQREVERARLSTRERAERTSQRLDEIQLLLNTL